MIIWTWPFSSYFQLLFATFISFSVLFRQVFTPNFSLIFVLVNLVWIFFKHCSLIFLFIYGLNLLSLLYSKRGNSPQLF